VHRSAFDPRRTVEAVQIGPRLIADGALVPGFSRRGEVAARAGVCIDRKGRIIFFCSTPEISGLSFGSLQSVLNEKILDCYDAVAVDGGSSAQLVANPGAPNQLTVGTGIPVPVLLLLVKR
jgi:uncharacterized protein YigE (DUF2233 family)